MHPTFSVIIPAYNSAAFLSETLESLLAQTFGRWEAVVVNDGSTDNTQSVIDGYCAKDSRIRCIVQTNAGVSAARNRGLAEAAGEYAVFLDADDLLAPDALRAFAEAADGADIVLGRLRFLENGKPGSFHAAADSLAACARVEPFDKRLLWNFLVCNKCYRRTWLLAHGVQFPASGFSEEGAFFMDAVYPGAVIAGTTGSVALYRRHTAAEGASVSQTANLRNLQSLQVSMRHISDAATLALKKAGRTDGDYLQEILYKHLHILASQFYRQLWQMDDEAATECARQMNALLSQLAPERADAISAANADLRLTQPCASRGEAAAQPVISVCVSRECAPKAAQALFAQSSPLFELLLTPAAAKELPRTLLDNPNVHVDAAFSPKGTRVLRLRTLPVLESGTLQMLLCRGLPLYGFVLRGVNAALKWRHHR